MVPYVNLYELRTESDDNLTTIKPKECRFLEDYGSAYYNVVSFGYLFGLGSVCVLSLVFNTINLWVLRSPQLRCYPINRYLLGLAAVNVPEALVILVISVDRCYACWERMPPTALETATEIFKNYENYIYYPMNNVLFATSSWITVIIVFERYLEAVASVQKKTCITSLHRIYPTIFSTYVIMIIFHIPLWLVRETVKYGDRYYSEFYYELIGPAALGAYQIIWSVVHISIPFLIILIITLILVKKTRTASGKKKKLDRCNSITQQTKTVIWYVAFYLLLNVQSVLTTNREILQFIFGKDDNTLLCDSARSCILMIGNTLEAASGLVPFIIHVKFNNKFRKCLLHKLARTKLGKILVHRQQQKQQLQPPARKRVKTRTTGKKEQQSQTESSISSVIHVDVQVEIDQSGAADYDNQRVSDGGGVDDISYASDDEGEDIGNSDSVAATQISTISGSSAQHTYDTTEASASDERLHRRCTSPQSSAGNQRIELRVEIHTDTDTAGHMQDEWM